MGQKWFYVRGVCPKCGVDSRHSIHDGRPDRLATVQCGACKRWSLASMFVADNKKPGFWERVYRLLCGYNLPPKPLFRDKPRPPSAPPPKKY